MSKNDLFLNCRRKMKELSKKELSNVTPASECFTPPIYTLSTSKAKKICNTRMNLRPVHRNKKRSFVLFGIMKDIVQLTIYDFVIVGNFV